jgi:hypothetical protein
MTDVGPPAPMAFFLKQKELPLTLFVCQEKKKSGKKKEEIIIFNFLISKSSFSTQ